jgi:hypothetical protein
MSSFPDLLDLKKEPNGEKINFSFDFPIGD